MWGGIAFVAIYYACIICILSSLSDLRSRSVNQMHINIKHILFCLVCQSIWCSAIDQQHPPVEKLRNDSQQTNLAVHKVEALFSD